MRGQCQVQKRGLPPLAPLCLLTQGPISARYFSVAGIISTVAGGGPVMGQRSWSDTVFVHSGLVMSPLLLEFFMHLPACLADLSFGVALVKGQVRRGKHGSLGCRLTRNRKGEEKCVLLPTYSLASFTSARKGEGTQVKPSGSSQKCPAT